MFKSLSQQVYEGAMDNYEHRGLVLRPNCVPEKVGVNHNWYSDHKQGIRVTECSQPNGVKPKMRVCKLRGGVNRRGALKQKRRTTIGRKRRPTCSCCPINFKRDTFVKYCAWLPIFMFREQDSVPGNGYLVSVQYDNVTPAEEAAGFTGTLYTAGPQPKFLRIPPPTQLCHATYTFRARPNFSPIPEIGFH